MQEQEWRIKRTVLARFKGALPAETGANESGLSGIQFSGILRRIYDLLSAAGVFLPRSFPRRSPGGL